MNVPSSVSSSSPIGSKRSALWRAAVSKSALEERFAAQLAEAGIGDYLREHRFCPPRQWRFDFAWPASALAVEIEGGTFVAGRHTRGASFVQDAEKYATAALLGWRVLRVPDKWLRIPRGTEGESEAVTWTRALLGRSQADSGEQGAAVG